VVYDGMAVVVHADNPVRALTKRQVEQIFTGAVTDWSALGGKPGPISVYTRNTSSGTYSDWKELAMNKKDYAKSSQKLAGNEQIVAEVARNPNGIGYVGLAYLSAPGIQTATIDGQSPSEEAIRSHKYPYARPTFFYTNGEPSGEAARFIEFVLSAEGQTIARKVGFVTRN
jgi:phosphate transport system substrate-binding protein